MSAGPSVNHISVAVHPFLCSFIPEMMSSLKSPTCPLFLQIDLNLPQLLPLPLEALPSGRTRTLPLSLGGRGF